MKIKINLKLIIIIVIILLVISLFLFFSYKNYINNKNKYYKTTINAIQKNYKNNNINKINNKKLNKIIEFYNKSIEIKKEFDKYTYTEFLKSTDLKNLYSDNNTISNNINSNITRLEELQKELKFYYTFDNLKINVDKEDKKFVLSNLNKNIFIENLKVLEKEFNENINKYNYLIDYINDLNNNSKLWFLNKDRIIVKTDEYKKYIETKNKELNISLITQKEVIYKKGNQLSIMMYHGINNNTWGGYPVLFVEVKNFDNQMKYLKDNGYETIFLSEIDKYNDFNKKIVITFDDGYDDLYINALPILKKYESKANVFVISEFLNKENYLTNKQLIEMANSGNFEIGSHTKNHNWLTHINLEEAKNEISESKTKLEQIINKKIETFAYPMGDHNDDILNYTKEIYKFAVTVERGKQTISENMNPVHLKRIPVNRGQSLSTFIKSIQ